MRSSHEATQTREERVSHAPCSHVAVDEAYCRRAAQLRAATQCSVPGLGAQGHRRDGLFVRVRSKEASPLAVLEWHESIMI